MRKALVFAAAFALVLIAGVAVAFMAAPSDDVAAEAETIDKPQTVTTLEKEKEEPPAEEEVKQEEGHKEEPPKEEEHDEDPPKEEETEEVKEEEDTTPPDIVILSPENGQHFDHREVAFEGKTEPGVEVWAGKYEADVDGEGHFRIVLVIDKNGSTATLTAVDEAGNEATAKVQVFYDAPEEEDKPKEEPKEHDFSAHQKYGSCGEDVPYDKWYGTGTPGTKIWIGNDWGSGQTTIGESGEWYLKVTFPEMPCGTHTIVLETDDGDRKVYEFTRVCNEGEEGGGEEGGDK
jgi:hypothetical protein